MVLDFLELQPGWEGIRMQEFGWSSRSHQREMRRSPMEERREAQWTREQKARGSIDPGR